jgi:lysophospholipase L1-like esterase
MKLSKALVLVAILAAIASPGFAQSPLFDKGARILFQGDSITDMGRGRTEDPNHLLGHGYAFIIAAREGAAFPERQLTFINRGIGGNTSADLAARWKQDTLDLKPDVLSILIGINDLGHAFRDHQTFSVDEFEQRYDQLLKDTVAALPNEHLDERKIIMPQMRAAVARLGVKYHAPVVQYQAMFDAAVKRAPIDYWIWDGVHPTFSGHQLMADEWTRTYRAFYGPPRDN